MILPVNYNELHHTERRAVREEYIKLQNGNCYLCGESLEKEPQKTKRITKHLYPPNFFNNPVHLHHCHSSGMTIGAVHCYCNAVLWEHYGE